MKKKNKHALYGAVIIYGNGRITVTRHGTKSALADEIVEEILNSEVGEVVSITMIDKIGGKI